MNKAFPLFFLFLGIASSIACHHSNKTVTDTKPKESKIIDSTFDIQLKVEELENGDYYLVAAVELYDGSFIISPFSEDDFFSPFNMEITKSDFIISENTLLEIPVSLPEIDPIINKPVRFVRDKTTYKRNLIVVEKEDFEVNGLIEFVLEPSCVPYDLEFVISQKAKKLFVKKTNTFISKEYKR